MPKETDKRPGDEIVDLRPFEAEPTAPPETDMPRFFEAFRESPVYRAAYDDFVATRPSPEAFASLSPEEQREFFESVGTRALDALDEYERKHPFAFVPENYEPGISSLIQAVLTSGERHNRAATAIQYREHDPAELQRKLLELDEHIFTFHSYAARNLVEHGLAPTEPLGRSILGLLRDGWDHSGRRLAATPAAARIEWVAGAPTR